MFKITMTNVRPLRLSVLVGAVALSLFGLQSCGQGSVASAPAASPYARPFPMPHGYWKKTDEFYCFASGGQQGGIYVYGMPSMKLLSEIPIFNVDPRWGWTTANPEVREMMTNPRNGDVLISGDTHHPVLSRTDGVYDGRWLFINDKRNARIARMSLATFRTEEILWLENVPGGMHGFNSGPNSELLVGNIELEGYPTKEIRDYLGIEIDKINGPYVSCVFGVKVAPDGSMKTAWQIWGPWQYDLVRVGWGESEGWFINTAYNTERSVNTVGMFKRPEDYVFYWNMASIDRAIEEGKFITTEEAPDVPIVRWSDVEVYAAPCPLNPHGLDIDPTGRYALSSGKATTLVRHYDIRKVTKAIADKKFIGEEFGVPVIDKTVISGDIDTGLGPTHIEYDNEGYAYIGFFVDSDVKKVALGEPWDKKHGKEPWTVVDTIPAHYSVGHLMVPGGDTAKPYGKYLVIMNKLTKDTFLPHGPLICENHELYGIETIPAPLIDQMSLPPESHYAQGIPVDLITKQAKLVYDLPSELPTPNVVYDYDKRLVHVTMTAVRSFFTPDMFTVPQGWDVEVELQNVEMSLDMTHGWALTGYDVMESIDPGENKTLEFSATHEGVFWYYCLWFCSELHMEMRGRMIVIPEAEWTPELEWSALK
jgi:nitrous-oxide reductase